MPELPEVETVVRDLDATGLRGSSMAGALIFWDRTIAEPAPLQFSSAIRGLEILGLSRRGKFIVLELSGRTFLLVHLRMTGRLRVATPDETAQANAHDRVVLSLTRSSSPEFGEYVLHPAYDQLDEDIFGLDFGSVYWVQPRGSG